MRSLNKGSFIRRQFNKWENLFRTSIKSPDKEVGEMQPTPGTLVPGKS